MDQTYGRSDGPDGWDIWRFLSLLGGGLSLMALASGEDSKELGAWGTVVSIGSSVLHAVLEPPTCPRCQRHVDRLPQGAGATWRCRICGWLS